MDYDISDKSFFLFQGFSELFNTNNLLSKNTYRRHFFQMSILFKILFFTFDLKSKTKKIVTRGVMKNCISTSSNTLPPSSALDSALASFR